MYNHQTDSPEILMYIDSANKEAEHYRFTGWIAHKTKNIKFLKIDGRQIPCIFIKRQDVIQVYPTISSPYVGVDFSLHKNYLQSKLTAVTEDEKEYPLCKMDKWAVLASGFQLGKRSITVIDDFYQDPDFVREYAINNLTFKATNYHKGKRSNRFIINGTKEKLEKIMGTKVKNWNHPEYANGVFQFCTKNDPIVYHCDTQTYAGAVYLTPNAPLRSGTSTYRSKLTGATRFNPEEFRSDSYLTTFSHNKSELNFYDNSTLEVVDSIANVYNRLIIWDGRAIHAGNGYFGSDINDSRFFQLFFFDLD